jgi:hypothetical protein
MKNNQAIRQKSQRMILYGLVKLPQGYGVKCMGETAKHAWVPCDHPKNANVWKRRRLNEPASHKDRSQGEGWCRAQNGLKDLVFF